jgi:hypothetical protein
MVLLSAADRVRTLSVEQFNDNVIWHPRSNLDYRDHLRATSCRKVGDCRRGLLHRTRSLLRRVGRLLDASSRRPQAARPRPRHH